VNPGGNVVFNINLHSNVTISGYHFSMDLYPYTTGQSGRTVLTQGNAELNCNGGYVNCQVSITVTIPSGANLGYYRGASGIFDANWSHNLFWLDAVVMIGIGSNYIVGGKGSPAGSASSSPKVYKNFN